MINEQSLEIALLWIEPKCNPSSNQIIIFKANRDERKKLLVNKIFGKKTLLQKITINLTTVNVFNILHAKSRCVERKARQLTLDGRCAFVTDLCKFVALIASLQLQTKEIFPLFFSDSLIFIGWPLYWMLVSFSHKTLEFADLFNLKTLQHN